MTCAAPVDLGDGWSTGCWLSPGHLGDHAPDPTWLEEPEDEEDEP